MSSPFFDSRPVTEVAAAASFRRTIRAVGFGTAVVLGGSLALTTLLGVAAITGMLVRGDTPQTVVTELPSSTQLALFCAAGQLLMSLNGGYVAATISGCWPMKHAIGTGILAAPLSLLVLAIFGDSGPAWLTFASIALIPPFAATGGWLASPCPVDRAWKHIVR
jgi:hypothetical protein